MMTSPMKFVTPQGAACQSSSTHTNSLSSRNPTPTPQKLKLSCDPCAKLKVGCPRQQPECERCINKGRKCVYSSSQRGGRRRQRKKPENINSKLEQAQTNPGISPTISANTNKMDSLSPSYVDGGFVIPALEYATTPTVFHTEPDPIWPSVNDILSNLAPCQSGSGVVPPNEQRVAESQLTFRTNTIDSHLWPPLPEPECAIEEESESESEDLPTPRKDIEVATSKAVEDALLFNPTTTPSSLPAAPGSCFRRICEAFQMLKKQSATNCMFGAPDSHPDEESNALYRNIEYILDRTERAIEEATIIMKCPCHTDSTIRCALTLLLFEIISWYDTGVKELKAHRTQNPCQPRNGDNGGPESPSSTSSDRSSMSIPPILIGRLMLGHDETVGILAHLILSKIKKIRAMAQDLTTTGIVEVQGESLLESLVESFEELR
ncbi:uncharacterized protein Z518_00502 [Rhinocladiella mackenziei CBS 650.93]|uniref:Zn(2)-C6 fungal-type domain-containing protein n=1 Tax=Rhinocladiella mackenziei CBS 650.93 TaxID=1442369 RepID=A0A0D2G444_9EURO|nr:uncharacterized protein Z518_00502 [Rhinocladiella mackenziei CBS 650.93]KIX09422.1 hypothetical protein Z518_00502 [Rhinocladiella mackenziei CBS 650.93]